MPRSEGIETEQSFEVRNSDSAPERMPRSEGIETWLNGFSYLIRATCPERMPRSEGIETFLKNTMTSSRDVPRNECPDQRGLRHPPSSNRGFPQTLPERMPRSEGIETTCILTDIEPAIGHPERMPRSEGIETQ